MLPCCVALIRAYSRPALQLFVWVCTQICLTSMVQLGPLWPFFPPCGNCCESNIRVGKLMFKSKPPLIQMWFTSGPVFARCFACIWHPFWHKGIDYQRKREARPCRMRREDQNGRFFCSHSCFHVVACTDVANKGSGYHGIPKINCDSGGL